MRQLTADETVNGPRTCPVCDKPKTHGSGLYTYYVCGHAYEKPLNEKDIGKIVFYPSPYERKKP